MYLQGVCRDSDIENRLARAAGEGEGGPNRARESHTCTAKREADPQWEVAA